ncbi:hypothetical protein [Methylobacterium sp. sgz302541]|uniref:hypothetical protein n=1 Tax=unclassified Methylobacterium TaxID=2615210 RepID=UPI003D329D39
MSAVHNEQTKLLATAINNVAVAFIVIGAVTPMTAASFGVPTVPTLTLGSGFFVTIWLCAGAALHFLARRALRSMKP